MRLIDGDKIIHNLKKWSNPTVAERNNWCIEVIEGEETVKAIPLDKIKQAREDIEELATEEIEVWDEENPYISGVVEYVSLAEVRELLDNLIAESEGE